MRYKRFEDLPVWNAAIDLAVGIYSLTSQPEFNSRYSLRDQIERAAISVSNNIAEGFERGTNNELLAFLYISRGSAGEVRSMLCLLERLPFSKSLRNEIIEMKQKAESCSKQLKAWSQSLQDSDFRGERHVNQKTKRVEQAARDREEFLKELSEIRQKTMSHSAGKSGN
jgi:four helix bundle protein